MRQAAEWAGVTRGTIHKAITSGRLSANKSDTGVYRINPAELERVYPRRQPVGVSGDTPKSHGDTPETPELAALRREVELLREGQRAFEARETDLRTERDRLLGIVESTTRLLTFRETSNPSETRLPPTQQILGVRRWSQYKTLFRSIIYSKNTIGK